MATDIMNMATSTIRNRIWRRSELLQLRDTRTVKNLTYGTTLFIFLFFAKIALELRLGDTKSYNTVHVCYTVSVPLSYVKMTHSLLARQLFFLSLNEKQNISLGKNHFLYSRETSVLKRNRIFMYHKTRHH